MGAEVIDHQAIREILDRVRRTETRVTIIGQHVGADVGGGAPIWSPGRIDIPTFNCSIGRCLDAVPDAWAGDVKVYYQGKLLFTFHR